MSLIVFAEVSKRYQDNRVLEPISLKIAEGEFVAVVGASGCGKTTFLRMLLGETRPSTGSITFDDRPLPAEPGPERGVVYQRYSVYPHLNVAENVLLGLELPQSRILGRLRGVKKRAAGEKVDEMLGRVGLLDRKHAYPAALSGGMQQRLALAQTLVTHPRVLLLDEPFGALDPGTRVEMHELVLGLQREQQLTVLMVTHDLHEAFKLGSRLLVFDRPENPGAPVDGAGASIVYDLPTDERVTS